MEKLSPNRAQFFVPNKYSFYYGWHCSSLVCKQKFFRRATVLQLELELSVILTLPVLY